MRRSVADLGSAVGGPARVRNADGALDAVFGHALDKLVHAGHGAGPLQDALIKRGDPAGVIATVFKATKPSKSMGTTSR